MNKKIDLGNPIEYRWSEDLRAHFGNPNMRSDRGGAIVAVAYLEASLTQAIKSKLVDLPTIADSLFRPGKPIGDLGAKSKLGLLLGLYKEKNYEDLECFRKIRNRFAHSHEPLGFTDKEIKSWIKSIEYYARFWSKKHEPLSGSWDNNALRWNFITSIELYSQQFLAVEEYKLSALPKF